MPKHPDYRKQWEAMGYTSKMGSAEVVLPPPKEYRRVYHLTSAAHGISDLSLGRMKVARFLDLNDPFELMAVRSRARYREERANAKAEVDNRYGLLCFSGNWTNPVLWGHYGDNHRGLCLGFNVRRERAEEVHYEDERIAIPWKDTTDVGSLDLEHKKVLFRTKFASWKYEEEWRVILPLSEAQRVGDMHFYHFGPDIHLAEVILGHRCALPLEEFRALVAKLYNNVTTILSRLADQHFGVVPEEHTIP